MNGDWAILQGGNHAPFGRGCGNRLLCAGFSSAADDFTHQGLSILRIAKAGVCDSPAIIPQFLREFAHCCKDQGNFFRMMRHTARFIPHFSHDHDVAGFICFAQRHDSGT